MLGRALLAGRSHDGSVRAADRSHKHFRLPRLGVFVDFDNVNGAAIPLVLNHLSNRWDCTWRRAYGTGLAKHAKVLHSSGILPIEVVQNTRSKNSAGIAPVIDVVLAACSDSVEAFCILASDGDYTRLALTLREKGQRLLVVGRATTPLSLRSACTEFIDLDELLNTLPGASAQKSPVATVPPSVIGGSAFRSLDHNGGEQPPCGLPVPLQVDVADLIPLIGELIGDRGQTTLKAVQIGCSRRYADFCPRMCGATKWRPLLQDMAMFSVEPIRGKGGKILDYTVRFRPAASLPDVLAQ
jgi:hypothetical protein